MNKNAESIERLDCADSTVARNTEGSAIKTATEVVGHDEERIDGEY
jgi:hypothetical protein